MSVCQMDDSPWCREGTCVHCDGARAELRPGLKPGPRTMLGRPLKPIEVDKAKAGAIPREVFDAFNDMIAKHWDGHEADFTLHDVGQLIRAYLKIPEKQDLDNAWLDIEPVYRKEGWSVSFESPVGYGGETFDAHYTFKKGRTRIPSAGVKASR